MNIQVTFVVDDLDRGKYHSAYARKDVNAGTAFPDRATMTKINNFAAEVAGAVDWSLKTGHDPLQFAEDGFPHSISDSLDDFAEVSEVMLVNAVGALREVLNDNARRADHFVIAAREAADEVLAKGDPEAKAVNIEGNILDGALMAGYLTAVRDLTTGSIDTPTELEGRIRSAGVNLKTV